MAQPDAEHEPGGEPIAFFVGDFNVGKSALINALMRTSLLHTGGEESRSLPTFVLPGAESTDFAAFTAGDKDTDDKTFEEFLELRSQNGRPAPYAALAARVAPPVFTRMTLVDTPGVSSDERETLRLEDLTGHQHAMLVVVTDIEYWFAKHTLELIAYHAELFEGRLVVVANKTDLLNASDIQRIQDKAARRMEEYGLLRPPPFFTLSAQLETARNTRATGGRRVRAKVRAQCDAAFDRFRLHLYEFEARCCPPVTPPPFRALLSSPLVNSFIAQHQGVSR